MHRCLTSSVTREMETKTPVRYHSIPTRMAKSRRLNVLNVVEEVEELELSYTSSRYVKWYNAFQKLFGSFLTVKPYACHMIQPFTAREKKVHVHTMTCTQMFTAALFLIAQNWKQPNVHQQANE